jgi:hypothetical protein
LPLFGRQGQIRSTQSHHLAGDPTPPPQPPRPAPTLCSNFQDLHRDDKAANYSFSIGARVTRCSGEKVKPNNCFSKLTTSFFVQNEPKKLFLM